MSLQIEKHVKHIMLQSEIMGNEYRGKMENSSWNE